MGRKWPWQGASPTVQGLWLLLLLVFLPIGYAVLSIATEGIRYRISDTLAGPTPTVTPGPPPTTEADAERAMSRKLAKDMADAFATEAAKVPVAAVGRDLNSNYGSIALNLSRLGFACQGDGPGMTCSLGGESDHYTVKLNGIAGSTSPNELVAIATNVVLPEAFSDIASAIAQTVIFDDTERREATKALSRANRTTTIGDAAITSVMTGAESFRLRITRP